MTVKELNKMRSEMYQVAMQYEDFAEAINNEGRAIVYEIALGDKHAVVVLTRESQMNYAFIESLGFDQNARVEWLFTGTRSTKTIYF